VSAAEWIAEAPSTCNNNRCTPLTLTNFGSLTFTNATATSVGIDGRQTGVIDDSDWIYGAIELESTNSRSRFNQNEPSEATTGTLAATGDSFSVTLRKRRDRLEWVLRLERHHRRHRRHLDGASRRASRPAGALR